MFLFTFGYEGLNIQQFLGFLKERKVKAIIDVRRNPLSRKPGFSKTALTRALTEEGINYIHLEVLGAPKEVRDAYKLTNNWEQYTTNYLQYLQQQAFVIRDLSKFVERETCCLLCFEADPSRCHRSFVADEISKQSKGKVKTFHITPQNQVRLVPDDHSLVWAGR